MALADALSRLGRATLLVTHQRLELAALDLEEEVLCTARLLVGALAAALAAALALACAAAFVVVLFWDPARLSALAGVTLAFAAGAVWTARRVAAALAAKPRFLATTLAQLRQDRHALEGRTQ